MLMVDPPDGESDVWNWRENVREGVEERMVSFRVEAANWIARQIAQQQDERPDLPLTAEQFTYDDVDFQEGTARSATDACGIQRYNGAAEWIILWENFIDGNPARPGRWVNHASNYVTSVCGELED